MTEAQAALSWLPIPVCWFDEDLNFMGANKKFLQIFELNEHQLIGEHFSELFDSYGFMSTIGQFARGLEPTGVFQQALLLKRKMVHFKFTFQKCDAGERMIILTLEDVTALVEKNQELESLKTKTAEASRMAILGEMTSGIGHEINNPLTIILAQVDVLRNLMKKSFFEEKQDVLQRLDKIAGTSFRIEKIVRGLKMYGRDSSTDPFQSTLVSSLISDSLELCVEKLRENEIRLIVDDFDPQLEIDCRPGQISQVLLNLIGNSKDAIATMDERWIRLQVKDLGDSVRFSLIDSGKGIPENITDKLTESFFTTKDNGKGTGLGLSISRKIAESHFGQLYLDKNSDHTKFVFEVPKGLAAVA